MQHLEDSRELVDEGVMIRTMQGRINSWDDGAAELYGWKEEEAIGKISHDLLHTQFPKPLKEIESELVRNGRWEGKLVHSTRNGARVVVKSQWSLNFEEGTEAVLEINTPAGDGEVVPRAHTKPDAEPPNKSVPSNVFFSKIAKAADFALIAGGALAALLTVYVIYYYGLSEQRGLSSPVAGILYALPAGGAVLLFSALRWKPANKVNLAMVFIACFISLYTVELFLRSLVQPRAVWTTQGLSNEEKQRAAVNIAKQFGVKFDIRDPIEVIADLQKRGVKAVPAIIPRNVLSTEEGKEVHEPNELPLRLERGLKSVIRIDGKEVIPLSGVARTITVLCNESGGWVTYRSDEHGFNNPEEPWRAAQTDIAALGDSFTEGYCVPPEKSFVGLIRQRYPTTLNLGMAGNGPLYMLASLQEYLPSFKPKVVLWFYFEGNDLPELQIESKSALLNQYMNPGFRQRLAEEQDKLDQALTAYIAKEAANKTRKRVQTNGPSRWLTAMLDIIKASALRERLGMVYGQTRQEQALISAVRGAGMYEFREVLSRANAEVRNWGGTLYFVYLPHWSRYANYTGIGLEQREQVLNTIRNLGIPIIDMHPAFVAHNDPLALFPFRGLGHYNEEGHRLVAEEILKVVFRKSAAQRSGDSVPQ